MTSSKGEGMKTGDLAIWIQVTTGTVHADPGCSVARGSTRYSPVEAQLTGEVQAALDSGQYRWCAKCTIPDQPGMKTGDLVTFAPRAGESAEGIITRVWDKPAADPYVTLRTTGDQGRTFTRCSSAVVRI
jgi:hypothetical protein